MKNKYFYPIFKLKAKSWIRYWLLKKTEFKGKLSEILTGFSFNLQNTLRQKFVKFEIQGHSIQDGEPSPKNEVPIKSTGENGSITEKIVNRNFLSLGNQTVSALGVTSKIEESLININGTSSNSGQLFNPRINKKIKAGTYKLSYIKEGTFSGSGTWAFYFNLYNKNGERIERVNLAPTIYNRDIVINEDIYYYTYEIYVNSANMVFNNFIMKLQLELGSTATDYVPHEEQTYSIYTQQPMRSIGDVRDCFVKKSDGWYERHYIGKVVLDGTESWGIRNQGDGSTTISFNHNMTNIGSTDLICNKFTQSLSSTNGVEGIGIPSQLIQIYIQIKRDRLTSLDVLGITTWLSENNVLLDYILATPIDLPCTTEQTNILENIPSTFAGQTNVYSTDEVEPFLKIQYWESDTNG